MEEKDKQSWQSPYSAHMGGARKDVVDILALEFHSFVRILHKWLIARALKSDLSLNPSSTDLSPAN